jgi:hypothetical protein
MTGILTFHRGPNYGGFLQAWHLKRAIETCTQDQVEAVNFQNLQHLQSETPGLSLRHPSSLKSTWRLMKKMRPFHAAIASLTSGKLITDSSRVAWDRYARIVVGSDVVWDFMEPRFGAEPAYFGMAMGQQQIPMVAYATSCGSTPSGAPAPEYVKQGLRRFDHILVRDTNTADLVERQTGKRPQVVVDPTWLTDDPELPCPAPSSQPYLLIYGTGIDSTTAATIRKFARRNSLAVFGVFCPAVQVDRLLWNITPFEWVALVRNAQALVTTSFHGTIYAAKYGVPVAFVRSPKTTLKTSSILQRCGLEDRSLAQGEACSAERMRDLLQRPTHVPEMASMRAESVDALSRALSQR